MRKLSVEDIVKDNENCYSFVVAIAKRARQISERANEESVILDDKPVHMAVNEFVAGKFRIGDSTSECEDLLQKPTDNSQKKAETTNED